MKIEFEKQYEEQLWKTKSYEIRNNADWYCSKCGGYYGFDKYKLHAHHKFYYYGEPIWSDHYKDGDIIALCSECHNDYHKNNKNEIRFLPNSNYINDNYVSYYQKYLEKKQEEEAEWMILGNDIKENEKYYKVEDSPKKLNLTKGDKTKIGKYCTKVCNYLGIKIKVEMVNRPWMTENVYPVSILKFTLKKFIDNNLT